MAQQIPIIITPMDYAVGGGQTINAFSPTLFFVDDNYGVQIERFIEKINEWIVDNGFVLNDHLDYYTRNIELPLADRAGSCVFWHSKDSVNILDDSPILFNRAQVAEYEAAEPNLVSRAVWHHFV